MRWIKAPLIFDLGAWCTLAPTLVSSVTRSVAEQQHLALGDRPLAIRRGEEDCPRKGRKNTEKRVASVQLITTLLVGCLRGDSVFGVSPRRLRRDPVARGNAGTWDYVGFGNNGPTIGKGDDTTIEAA
jgi:hypothetical protein